MKKINNFKNVFNSNVNSINSFKKEFEEFKEKINEIMLFFREMKNENNSNNNNNINVNLNNNSCNNYNGCFISSALNIDRKNFKNFSRRFSKRAKTKNKYLEKNKVIKNFSNINNYKHNGNNNQQSKIKRKKKEEYR